MPKNHSAGSAETWRKISFTCRTSVEIARLLGFITTSTFVPDDRAPAAPAAAETATAASTAAASITNVFTGSTRSSLQGQPGAAAEQLGGTCRSPARPLAVRAGAC